jgi:hypothetical protein
MSGELSFRDDWEAHIADRAVWVRFWALWELRRKWKWADSFYQQVDRVSAMGGSAIVEPEAWGTSSDLSYLKLCMWISLLRSVHEGLTLRLDAYDTPSDRQIQVAEVFSDVPEGIREFPSLPYRAFRNVVFHCQWHPGSSKLRLGSRAMNDLERFHNELGRWLEEAHVAVYPEFKTKYNAPDFYFYSPDEL